MVLTEGIDTVDATAVKTSFLGHSYYGSNDSVISDLDDLIRDGTHPDERERLRGRGAAPRRYWLFRPPEEGSPETVIESDF